MEISAVDTTTSSDTQSSLGGLQTEDFLELLVAEMENQDPFEPSDTSDLVNQISQIRTIEQSNELTDTLEALVQQQSVSGVTELIGKYIQAIVTDDSGNETVYEGVVTSVYFNSDGSTELELDTGDAVSADDVVLVTTLEQVEEALAELEAGSDESDQTDDA